MAGARGLLDQIEFRWAATGPWQHIGYGPIASSNNAKEFIDLWYSRLKMLVGPPNPQSTGPRAPEAGVVYQVFEDATAALIWRHWMPAAVPLADEGEERRPLVARALVGPAAVLRPDVVLPMAYRSLPGAIGPAPGSVHRGFQLRPIDAGDFAVIARESDETLRAKSRSVTGVEPLVATVLRAPGEPLSVVLPDREVVRPLADGCQVPLLRALWGILGELLHDSAGRPLTGWRWTFSTYESQQGDKQTGQLPHLIFRAPRASTGGPPDVIRTERVVRPFDRAGDSTADRDKWWEIAQALGTAYRESEPHEFAARIHLITAAGDLPVRLAAVLEHLGEPERSRETQIFARGPALWVGVASETTRFPVQPPGTPGEPVEAPAETEAVPGIVAAPEPEVPDRAAAEETDPGEHPDVDAPRPGTPETALGEPSIAPQADPAPRHPVDSETEHTVSATVKKPAPERLPELFGQVAVEPQGSEPRETLRRIGELARQEYEFAPEERAAARAILEQYEWFVAELAAADGMNIQLRIRAMLRLAVLPDLGLASVQAKLAEWVADYRTPVVVALEIDRVARREGRNLYEFHERLAPAIATRWRFEHGIHDEPPSRPPPRRNIHHGGPPSAVPGHGRAPWWSPGRIRGRGTWAVLFAIGAGVLILTAVILAVTFR
ncbi:hypothetical protein [Rhizohabitans arisaemae]|uniref:hypothetical protein n=1 Tax=Rhizohabitans arisaemae TaxID=2720610 RepID=UPI0024B22805|nr:hypothetical protein [Rhizohabitans arisaemae]